jgi:hypothetical protein
VRRVLKKVPADLILDPVVRSDIPGTDGLRDGRERCEDNAERAKTRSLGEGSNDNCSLYWVDRCRATLCLAAPY